MSSDFRILPLSELAVVVEFGRKISIALNDKALSLAADLQANPFPGFIEAVPAYASTTVFFDPIAVRKEFVGSAFDAISDVLIQHLNRPQEPSYTTARIVEIPLDFGKKYSLDMADICSITGLPRDEIIERFLSKTYRVYMLGFLPGFAYMGEVDETIAVPRKETPRSSVPKGSVGIAGRQTGIYPLESPGGWQIIGRTQTELFAPKAESPCLLKPGDQVQFTQK